MLPEAVKTYIHTHRQEAVDTLQEALDCYARAGHTSGPDIEGYRKNLEICRHALKMVAPGTTPQVSDD